MAAGASGEWQLSMGKLAGGLIAFVFVVATGAGTWAAYSYSYAAAMVNSARTAQPSDPDLQAANSNAKGDRLAIAIPAAAAETIAAVPVAAPEPSPAPTSYAVAALTTTAVAPPKLRTEPYVESRKPAAAPEKPKRIEQQKLLLDDAQIASLRTRLKLTPTQEEFWPAIEVTLRDVVRAHARKSRRSARGTAPQIDVNSAEVQQLIAAATPLIMRLSEEQKREVRALARVIGLETVAARI
jgi:hypothetical protein